MKRLIKKTPHRQGAENWILAYGKEYDGKWQKTESTKTDEDGIKRRKYDCVSSGTVCNIGTSEWR